MNHQFTEEEEKDFDRRFDNYAYIAELYVEAQMGDLNLLSLKDWIRAHDQRLLSHIREEVDKLGTYAIGSHAGYAKIGVLLSEVLALLT